jgi:hypothetical protein
VKFLKDRVNFNDLYFLQYVPQQVPMYVQPIPVATPNTLAASTVTPDFEDIPTGTIGISNLLRK